MDCIFNWNIIVVFCCILGTCTFLFLLFCFFLFLLIIFVFFFFFFLLVSFCFPRFCLFFPLITVPSSFFLILFGYSLFFSFPVFKDFQGLWFTLKVYSSFGAFLYWFFYLHWSRDLVFSLCRIFLWSFSFKSHLLYTCFPSS